MRRDISELSKPAQLRWAGSFGGVSSRPARAPGQGSSAAPPALGALGAAAVPYLAYVELAVLGAVCTYCTAMRAMILAVFATAIAAARRLRG